ncbi:hypothetical protein SDC9_191811 [bioreactor metagenome]|uniref:Uncharacterized protein n=1 Tax=bioreactor metagenome TaxID=1076179 RepID=A0A645I1E4_9ZZZZ
MLGEAEIDQPPLLRFGRFGVARDQRAVFVERLDLPDDVVAALHAAQHGVEAGQAGGGGE